MKLVKTVDNDLDMIKWMQDKSHKCTYLGYWLFWDGEDLKIDCVSCKFTHTIKNIKRTYECYEEE